MNLMRVKATGEIIEVTDMPGGCTINNFGEPIVWCKAKVRAYTLSALEPVSDEYHMTWEESQDYIFKRGLSIPWNDDDVFIDERDITRTVGNVLKWADHTMIERVRKILKECVYDRCVEFHEDCIDDICKELEANNYDTKVD